MKHYPNIIKQNELITIDMDDKCPFCCSVNVVANGYSSTAVGFIGERFSYDDSNHYWFTMHCKDCKKIYIKQQKSGLIWFTLTDNKTLIKGMPNCFEEVFFQCNYCNGKIKKFYTKIDGITKTHSLIYEDGKEKFRTFYKCCNCKEIEEE